MRLKKFLKYLSLSLSITLLIVVLGLGIFPNPARLAALEAMTPIATNQSLSSGASGLAEQGKQSYQSGQFAAAVDMWKQAADAFANQGDRLNQAMVLSNLSLAYQQLGKWPEAKQAIGNSLELLKATNQGHSSDYLKVLAQALNTQGSLQLAQGQPSDAFATWQQAGNTYQQAGDREGVSRSLLNQAQALKTMGLYPRACQTLLPPELKDKDCRTITKDEDLLVNTLKAKPDSPIEAAQLLSLGDALRLLGKPQESEKVLQLSLAMAKRLESPSGERVALAQLSLGNTQQALGRKAYSSSRDSDQTQKKIQETLNLYQQALDSYQQAANTATSPTTKIQALLNRLSLLVETRQPEPFSNPEDCQKQVRNWSRTQDLLLSQIQNQLKVLPLGRTAVYAQINFAQNLMELHKQKAVAIPEIAPILDNALQQARVLQDPQAQSYALGYLGQLSEQEHQLSEAQNFTQQALNLVQDSDRAHIAYRWQWQLGRIYKAQIDLTQAQNQQKANPKAATPEYSKALSFYNAAFKTLQTLRQDLATSDPDLQFSFQEKIEEKVYRQLVELLLNSNPSQENLEQARWQQNLRQAREVMESLQIVALENFLQQPCASANPNLLDNIVDQEQSRADKGFDKQFKADKPSKTAVIYSIILSDSLHGILKLPGQKNLQHYSSNVTEGEIREQVEKLQRDLQEGYTFDAVKQESAKLYSWLIAPIKGQLEAAKINTLVFVQDGPLRNIPMTTLYDGKNYLIENYAIAESLGLNIANPQPLPKQGLKVLVAGLAILPEKPEGLKQEFAPLENVRAEIKEIQKPGIAVTQLSDLNFTSKAFNNKLNQSPFQIVHLATHGEFSSAPEDTFILNADGKISIDQLDTMFRSVGLNRVEAIELLILNACETASGDSRAPLGIAGTTVKAGARSVIASLWSLGDESSVTFTQELYTQLLKPGVTKAEAMRQAQLKLMKMPKYEHPKHWAPYILAGNWL